MVISRMVMMLIMVRMMAVFQFKVVPSWGVTSSRLSSKLGGNLDDTLPTSLLAHSTMNDDTKKIVVIIIVMMLKRLAHFFLFEVKTELKKKKRRGSQ